MTASYHTALRLSIATESDRAVLEQLWTMFRHDMSAHTGALPDERGRFRQERLDSALRDDTWRAYILRLGAAPVGLCVIRDRETSETVISSFFLVNAARRLGHGRSAIREITRAKPGRWAVAFQQTNPAAAAFWSTVASEADAHWTRTREAVPGRPDLPADHWIRFEVG
jgi:predicted acetyltransferase